MAFASILRKPANSLAPHAIRLARIQRNYHSCIVTRLNHSSQYQNPAVNTFYPNTHRSSAATKFRKANDADESLLRHLESIIQGYQVEAACGFPFKMEDKKCGKITLTREYNGELIKN
ncbi:hypothetical protein COLO4_00068 [Corchorus olitorius]|uniref:Uncharacterized protein n=1 Tax=Corchorus olitorius TaxID=93759 RepID=A0A1R3L4S0_9ROSI|nr:hypothetical protein COLO4_00068 [Corchorus olitorius]